VRGRIVPKLLVAAALALLGFTAAATAQTHQAALEPVAGVRPVWSPNGKQLAFATRIGSTTNGSWSVTVLNADGTGRKQLTTGSLYAPQGIAWSADGTRLAYDAFVGDGPTSVYTVAVAGGAPRKVTTGWTPAWGPKSTLLVVDTSETQYGRDMRLYQVNADGSGRKSFVECPEVSFEQACGDTEPAWSPDGTKLAFSNNPFGAASAITIMDADGSNRVIRTSYSPPATSPVWSGDGKSVYYQHVDTFSAANNDISVINADGTGDKVLVKNARQPSISPDGRTLLFVRDLNGTPALYAADADGSNIREFQGTAAPVVTTTTTASRCLVPALKGKTVAAAKKLLALSNCKAGKVKQVKSRTVAKGKIVASSPKAGASKPAGFAVALTVSKGR
jgi:Tol biopolymer transport system component